MKKRIVIFLAATMAAMVAFAAPEVTDVVAKQRYPWNGLVDITCKVTGISGTDQWKFSVAAVMPDTGNARKVYQFWVVKNGVNSTDKKVQANGTYKLLWDAKAELGQVAYDNMVMRVTAVELHGKVQLWEGGPYWADTNIGAENPEDYGYYFWWGDTLGYKRVGDAWVASDGSSSNFSFSEDNTPTYNKSIETLQNEGWITADGVLAPAHDAAHVQWGGGWRMPTKDEISALNNNCDWTWTTTNGVNGYVVRGRGDYAPASIFFPCAGHVWGTSRTNVGSYGFYWSSVPSSDHNYYAWSLDFHSRGHNTIYNYERYNGRSVRPVQGFTEIQTSTAVLAGNSAPFRLDTITPSTTTTVDSLPISYDASWVGGNANATVVIADNGTEVKRTTGAGEFTYAPTSAGQHNLTYTTYIGGLAQDEVYTASFIAEVYIPHIIRCEWEEGMQPPASQNFMITINGADIHMISLSGSEEWKKTISLKSYDGICYGLNAIVGDGVETRIERVGCRRFGEIPSNNMILTESGWERLGSVMNTTMIYTTDGWKRLGSVYSNEFVVVQDESYGVFFKVTIASIEMANLKDAFDGLPATIESDGEGGWIVTITNDIDAADLPIELPDNLGPVTIDLNGHDLVGDDGQPAIVVVPGEGDGEPTVITIVNSGDDATVQGGEGAPAIEVDDGAQDGVRINIGEGVTVQGGGDDVPAIIGEVGTNEGTIVEPSRIHIPGEGTVVVPKSWKVGQKVTWKATAAKGSVFARWEGAFVDLLNLTKNERRNPSLAFVVPVGFDTNGISAVFISVDDDRLGTLALSQPGPLAPNADVAGLSLVDDSESYVTASVSGLPTGLKFNAKTLAVTGKPTKPGVYTVKVTAKNASGYQWAENIALRVADIENARIDFGGLPETGAVGEPFAGRIAAGEFKSLSASGWPSGVKFDAKTGAVAGIPTKGGYFTVTVTATYADKSKATATRLLTISPAAIAEPKRTAYHPLTVVPANAAGGTATGTGVYAEGKKVSISAKPAKGYVFAGWYRDPDLTEPMAFAADDWRKASQSVVVPEVRYLFARFVTEREDGNNIALAVDDVEMASGAGHQPYQTNVMCGVYMEWPVAVETLSLPTVAVAGLPSGLKFTAKPVTSKIGSGKTAVTVTNVPAYTIYGAPTAASKVDTKTGAVKPSAVKVTVTTASKAKVVYEIDVTVDPMNEWAVGTFDGYVRGSGTLAASGEEDSGEGSDMGVAFPKGLATVTVAANGKISGKVIDADGTWTLSAASFDSYDAESETYVATVIGKNGKMTFTNEMEVSAEEVRLGEDASPHRRGVVTGWPQSSAAAAAEDGRHPEWTAWQNLWKTEPWKTDAKPFAKAPALAIDAGTRDACPYPGTITLKFAASGAVTASGKFVTGQDAKGKDVVYSASCSSVLVPEADAAGAGRPPYRVFLYFPPKAGKFEGYADEVSLEWDGAVFSPAE